MSDERDRTDAELLDSLRTLRDMERMARRGPARAKITAAIDRIDAERDRRAGR